MPLLSMVAAIAVGFVSAAVVAIRVQEIAGGGSTQPPLGELGSGDLLCADDDPRAVGPVQPKEFWAGPTILTDTWRSLPLIGCRGPRQ